MNASRADQAIGRRGVVASVNPIATAAGLRVMEDGGNAIDAAVATALMLGVVDTHNSGLGGGCFVLMRTADGTIHAIDGREMAPAAATADMFIRDGVAVPSLSQDGALAIGVPGALATYRQAMSLAGRGRIEDYLRAAARVADSGFAIDTIFARNLAENRDLLAKFPELSRIILHADGSARAAGETVRMPDLATTYRAIADDPDWFYRGDYAQRVAAWMAANGGVITAADFAAYRSLHRNPIRTTYRGHEIIGFPPPTSGGVQVAQMLNVLEYFPLSQWFRDDPAKAYHVIAETMKLSFADRTHWIGDADFADVPRGLVDKGYARRLAAKIDVDRVVAVASHDTPDDWQSDTFGRHIGYPPHTTHITAADEEGNWVAITATINTSFGSKVVIPGTGLVLNNTLDDFAAQAGIPNAFGMLGGTANEVAAAKRPLSAMSPTIVIKDGRPLFTVGVAGGPKIITQVLMAIVHVIDAGDSLDAAINRPRMHHQWMPPRLFYESGFDAGWIASLQAKGHVVEPLSKAAIAQGIQRTADGDLRATSDPRVPGLAAAR